MKRGVINRGVSDSDNFNFSALRGIQGGKEFYVAICPLKLIPSIFEFDGEGLPPELRAQRVLNKSRIPEIVSYITENSKDYIFSSITASIDGEIEFIPNGKKGMDSRTGKLVVPINSRFLINDGQHRRAAIEEALRTKPDLGHETISVVFYIDKGLKHSQQMFSDLNKYAIRPTKSLNILYDNRDKFSVAIIQSLLPNVPIFNGITDLERTSISNRSNKVFTLNSLFAATKSLLGKTEKKPTINNEEIKSVVEFWNETYKNIKEWQEVVEGKTASHELREKYVHTQGVLLHALGMVGNHLIKNYPKTWKPKLKKLKNIDWKRENKEWKGRAIVNGRLSKAHTNISLTSNLLKNKLGLKLDISEQKLENKFKGGKNG